MRYDLAAIADATHGFSGRIPFKLCIAALVAVASASAPAQRTSAPAARPPAFAGCAACHSVVVGGPAGMGPNLARLGGRKAGSAGYAYSPAMKASKIVWNRATLIAFITSPRAVVPGTRMAYAGQKNPAAAAAIADYLIPPKR